MIENIIGSSRLGPAHGITINKHPAIGDINFFSYVIGLIPPGTDYGRSYKFGADIAFT